jgi:hypothetical protein
MFKSKAQSKYMWVHHPTIAKEFADKTANMKSLPEHISKNKKKMVEAMSKKT